MKRIFFIFAFCFSAIISGFSQKAKHVILISIDGFRPDFYVDKSWNAPNLQKLLAGGVYAKGVNSVFPSVTYPSHTTLVTGALPARHGIYYNVPVDSKKGRWYWEESYIKTLTLWDAVKKAGLTSGAIMWPVTVGAPINYNFPVLRADNDETTDQLSVTRPHITPANLIAEMEKETAHKFTKADFNHHHLDQTTAQMANYIIAKHKPNLMAIHFLTMDHAGHDIGRDGKELREGITLVDSLIGSVLATVEKAGLKNNTALIITGDHGMVKRTTSFAPNIWLAKNGLLTEDTWAAKFNNVGGSAFLYLKDKNDAATLQKVQKILAGLPEDQKRLFRVIDRKELDKVGANPEVSLALACTKGVIAINGITGEVVKPVNKGGTHGYFPDFPEIQTGFIAIGAGINEGIVIPEMGIKDISPIIAQLLGLDFKAPDGVIIPQILKK